MTLRMGEFPHPLHAHSLTSHYACTNAKISIIETSCKFQVKRTRLASDVSILKWAERTLALHAGFTQQIVPDKIDSVLAGWVVTFHMPDMPTVVSPPGPAID